MTRTFFFLVIDEDGNGSIDPQELKNCFHKLEINFTDEEIDGLFEECDINDDMRITFNEFIVLLCLVNLLQKDPVAENCVSKTLHLHLFCFCLIFENDFFDWCICLLPYA